MRERNIANDKRNGLEKNEVVEIEFYWMGPIEKHHYRCHQLLFHRCYHHRYRCCFQRFIIRSTAINLREMFVEDTTIAGALTFQTQDLNEQSCVAC